MSDGVWRTINGTRVFIPNGKTLDDAMAKAGFSTGPNGTPKVDGAGHLEKEYLENVIVEMRPGDDKESIDKRDELRTNIKSWTEGYYDDRKKSEQAKDVNDVIDYLKDSHWNDGALYRGVLTHESYVDEISPGDTINMRGTSSWTSTVEKAEMFSGNGRYNGLGKVSVVFVENSTKVKNAVSLKGISVHPSENEVVYHGKQEFKIKSISRSADGRIYTVDVEEKRR